MRGLGLDASAGRRGVCTELECVGIGFYGVVPRLPSVFMVSAPGAPRFKGLRGQCHEFLRGYAANATSFEGVTRPVPRVFKGLRGQCHGYLTSATRLSGDTQPVPRVLRGYAASPTLFKGLHGQCHQVLRGYVASAHGF